MPSRATVLVLGAGASKPYGFPTGSELKELVWRALVAVKDNAYQCKRRERFLAKLRCLEFEDDLIFEFGTKLRHSPRESVDAFLEHQPRYLELGRAAIACALIPLERARSLTDRSKPIKGDWYKYFYNQVCSSPDDTANRAPTVLTYNYDRSFETYLRAALQNDFDVSAEQAQGILSSFPFIHLHGSLGDQPYGGPVDHVDLGQSAQSIRIISHDEVESDEAFKRARNQIMNAERICFLGFGYDKNNLQRLRISNEWLPGTYGRLLDHPAPPSKRVSGTTYGLTDQDMERISGHFSVGTSFDPRLRNCDVLAYLQNTDILG